MLNGARLLVATSLGLVAVGCTQAPAPHFGTLNPAGIDDYYLKQYDIEAVRRMVPQGPAFNDQLRVGYLELADTIGGRGDGGDEDHFLRKAVASAKGLAQVPDQVVMPDGLEYRAAGTDADGALATGRARLLDAFGRNARKLAPLDAASAQVAWDCWFEGAEAGRLDQVAECRKRFEDAMDRVDAALDGDEEQAFIVFFAWDDATITPVGQTVLEEVAAAYRSGQSPRIVLAGHADRSGTEAYNLQLSERRAKNAAALLTTMGVPAEAMDVTWYGETRPRVPTEDGVREPQNRRVEFTLPAD
ncbi:MAG TPA: OmpA family protein [Geminicoccus sp.]|uniref:OmpA family protein n=1 Tax=Geminicoccus sp. TaxID=2024832 RepID=UPI002B5F0CF8|nr:OmpA family protein [Geminicoccus sp.]HWL68034.1 OmpA family protein [Geminicoccus sp.]